MSEQFRWILDEVPEWWKRIPGVQVNIPNTIASVPHCELIHPGDWIVREADGSIRREINVEGRAEAEKYLRSISKEAKPNGED